MAKKNEKESKAPPKITYLVCVNKEDYSRVALRFACALVKNHPNATISLLNVMEPADYQSFGAVADKMRTERRQEAEKLLNCLSEEVLDSKITPILIVREGLIEEEIIKVVEEYNNIQMLIVGVAHKTSIKSKIVPPLVSQIGQKVHVPMMIIPGSMKEEQIALLTGTK
jgi:nucleotide-binding universal stress UspA family protein